MIEDMYSVMTRINEIRKRFSLNKHSAVPAGNGFQQELQKNMKNGHAVSTGNIKEPVVVPNETKFSNDALRQMAREVAIKRGVPAGLVDAVVSTESSYKPRAISPKGAQGLMQLMPRVSAMMGVQNPLSPAENLDAGVGLLRTLLDKYGWDYKKALAAYNAGEKAVDENNGVPPYGETREYVRKVMDNYLKNAQ